MRHPAFYGESAEKFMFRRDSVSGLMPELGHPMPDLQLLGALKLAKVDTIIPKAYKQAMRLPASTSTDRILKFGIHSTAEESIEAHLSN